MHTFHISINFGLTKLIGGLDFHKHDLYNQIKMFKATFIFLKGPYSNSL